MNKNNQRKKICHILTDKNIGGAGRWLLYYLKYCNREIFEVKVILPRDSQLVPEVKKTGIGLILIEMMEESSYDRGAIRIFTDILKKEKPDIVHTHASFSARIAARRAKVKTIMNTKHCMESISTSRWKRMLKGWINCRYSDKIIAVSEAVKQSMIAGGTDPNQIVTIYNGVDLLSPLKEERKKELKKAYQIEENKFTVGILARLEEVKDHHTFLLAAKKVIEMQQNITFLIAGTGSLEEKLKQEAKDLGLLEHLVFTGFVKEIEELTALLDLNVITSKEEALCLSIIEGMSIGIPAVGTDSGGVREIIQSGENGELIPIGDWEALANKIMTLAIEKKTYERYSENAIKTVKRYFLARNMVQKIEALYLEINKEKK